MKRLAKFACLATGLLLLGGAGARDVPESRYPTNRTHTILTNAGTSTGTATRDTIYLMGGDGDWSGRFETPGGTPSWHDWTHYDNTAPLSGYWHVDTYHMENLNDNGAGNHGAWCGSILLPACPGETEPGGYGNDWYDGLDYWGTVADPGVNTSVNIDFTLAKRGHVTVKIYNVRGALLRTLVDDVRDAGVTYEALWNGTDDRGADVSSGLYFYEVKSGGMTKVSKMTHVK